MVFIVVQFSVSFKQAELNLNSTYLDSMENEHFRWQQLERY